MHEYFPNGIATPVVWQVCHVPKIGVSKSVEEWLTGLGLGIFMPNSFDCIHLLM